ncbi:elongation factor G [Candidatus Acetothermia bacterium]|nr:elongation factor G [Candidatus Acetothermia bacterium]MBI3460756.1 elongation factor G [Candidatus Acetothermia bacterium]
MKALGHEIEKIRNIGVIAHIDAGKTTTTERLLFYTGRIHDIGDIDEGDTEMDWMPQERERGITITSAATTCFWRGYQINIIDTPGHVDFTAEVERSLRVLDGAVTVFSAVDGVEPQSEQVWRQADKYGVPRIAYINKIDRIGANFQTAVQSMVDKLSVVTMTLQYPHLQGDTMVGIVDLLQMKMIVWDLDSKGAKFELKEIPQEIQDKVKAAKENLLERLAETDDQFMMKFLDGHPFTVDELKEAVRKAALEKEYVPVVCGSSLKNIGVQPLLDAIVDYLPSPLDRGTIEGNSLNGAADGAKLQRQPSPDDPLSGLAFKVQTDEYTGRLVYVRVYSGKLESGSYILNSTTGKKERISRLFHMHANKRTEVEAVFAGNIAAIVGPKELITGDTICDPDKPIILEKIEFPEPVVTAAVEAKTSTEEDKLSEALYKLAQEDPTFRFKVDPETNQMIVSGMGELHLEIIHDRLQREFKVESNLGRPQVAYKETLAEPVDIEEKFIKQTGGRGQYAHVCIKFEPLSRGGGFEFVDEVKGGAVPREYIPAVNKGLKESLSSGPLGGFPIVDIRATLHYGSYHDVDSSEIAFKTAAAHALTQAFQQAKANLLEPIMTVEITTPEDYVGEIINDLQSRRAQVTAMEIHHHNTQIIKAQIPLASTFGYATRLRSLSQGRAAYHLQFSHYEVVPPSLKEEVLKGRK